MMTTLLAWIVGLFSVMGISPMFGANICFPVDGCTGTSTVPTADQILIGGNNSRYDVKRLVAGSNITIATSSGQVTISSTASGSGSGMATTSIDTEAELEDILTDVTNVFTNNDTIDISANTNLAATYPVLRTDDTLSLAFGTTTSNTWA